MTFRSSIRASAVVSAVAIALAACGGGDTGTAATSVDTAPVETATGTASAVFVPLADGTQFDFNSLQGQDVLLWFWAPW